MTASLLLSLPFEIREAILKRALYPSNANDVRTTNGLNTLVASKQLYRETHLLLFQHIRVALPGTCDSSTSATHELLRRLSSQQRNSIRALDLQVVGSTLDAAATVKVLKFLRLGNADGDLDTEMGAMALPPFSGELKDVSITVSARNITVPLANCGAGLQQTLAVESCSIFAWLRTFRTLRNLHLAVRLSAITKFSKIQQAELDMVLKSSMHSSVQVQTTFDVVGEDGYLIDELCMRSDSYPVI